MSDRVFDRRLFLGGSATALGYFFTADAWSAVRAADNPSGKLRVAGVGVGGKGSSDIDQAGSLMDVTVLCDCDRNTLGKKAEKFKAAKTFTDFRRLFDDGVEKTFDALTVSTPDHTHTWPAVTGMRLKKHVYVQKPLTHSPYEARLMRETAKKFGVCTQMGNQGSAENGLRRAVELVQEGILGTVKEIHVWTNRPVWPQAPQVTARPKTFEEPPAHVDWEAFIGPAPMRPFSTAYHPFKWRGWWDFGTGALGDMACHTANMAYRACELGLPTAIEADVTDLNPETFPSSARVRFEYPSRGDKPHQAPLTFWWYEGKREGKKVLPPQDLLNKVLAEGQKLADSGSIIVGDKAILFSPNDYGAQFRILAGDEELAKGDRTPKRLPINGKGDTGMKAEWLQAIREGKPEIAYSNFEIAGMLTEAILLGNVAMRAGKKLEYDPTRQECPNNKEVSQYIRREYRKGWELADRA